MKSIGITGGMSWESSIEYYRMLNETEKAKSGGLHSVRSIMYCVNFVEIEKLHHKGKWDEATALMIDAATKVAKRGADFLIICTNTMHKMADEAQLQKKY